MSLQDPVCAHSDPLSVCFSVLLLLLCQRVGPTAPLARIPEVLCILLGTPPQHPAPQRCFPEGWAHLFDFPLLCVLSGSTFEALGLCLDLKPCLERDPRLTRAGWPKRWQKRRCRRAKWVKRGMWECTLCWVLYTLLLSIQPASSLGLWPLAIPWPKPLTLLELGETGALNSSPHPSSGHSGDGGHQEALLAWSRQWAPEGKLWGPLSCEPWLRAPQGQLKRGSSSAAPQPFLHFTLINYLLLQASGTSQAENTLIFFLFFFPLEQLELITLYLSKEREVFLTWEKRCFLKAVF